MLNCRIDAVRREFGCTRAWLAKACGIPYSTMTRLCKGEVRCIKYEHLEAMCRVLHCRPGDLLQYTPGDR